MQSETKTPRVRNDAMIREVVRHIRIMPHRWYQRAWALTADERANERIWLSEAFVQMVEEFEANGGTCGTTFCVAGWAARLGGYVDDKGKPTPKGHNWVLQADLWGYESGEEKPASYWINEDTGQVGCDEFWTMIGAELLGISRTQATRIFGADFAVTVAELIEKLSTELNMTFDDPDPHDINPAQAQAS
jgi:hypothetical protein